MDQALKERFPDLPLLTTAHDGAFGQESGLDAIDAWCPGLWHYDYEQARQARAAGKQVCRTAENGIAGGRGN